MTPLFHQQVLDIIREAVKQYGSAAALSRATGVSTANLSRWINGKQIPRLNVSIHAPAWGATVSMFYPVDSRD